MSEQTDLSVYCYGLEFICIECTKKYGQYRACPKEKREEQKCGWCGQIDICIPVHYAGWPNIKDNEAKPILLELGTFKFK